MRILLAAVLIAVAGACAGDTGPQGAPGEPGEPCTAVDNGDGTTSVTCGATTIIIADGRDGDSCTAVDNGDGTKTITCGTTTATVADGSDGDSCGAVDNGDGTFTITCGDSAPVVVTDPSYVPAAYTAADGIAGGTAYSKWWVTQAGGDGSLETAGVTVGAEWVRCKTCHAWDGLGNAGSYASRTGQSTGTAARPDVSTVDLWTTIATATPLELFALVRGAGGRPLDTAGNGHPDYSSALTDEQIWNIVKFMREEWIRPDSLYRLAVDGPPVHTTAAGTVVSPTLIYFGVGADGDATSGDAIYAAACGTCHGTDGRLRDLEGQSVGEVGRGKPHELWHKIKFGDFTNSSGVNMEAGILTDTTEIVDLYRALTDVTAYPAL